MRDIHGRYRDAKAIVDLGPEWAHGCEDCQNGIAIAPELTGGCELYLERIVQLNRGEITFCDCQAGSRYRSNLLNRRQILIEEARKDPRMAKQAANFSHPDIQIAAWHIDQSYRATPAPTVHFEGEIVAAAVSEEGT